MAVANYAFPARQTCSLVRENNLWMDWVHHLIFKPSTPSSFIPASRSAMEEEIYSLRTRMEQMYDTEQSLTAPQVVEISMELDQKINQWMEMQKSQSR